MMGIKEKQQYEINFHWSAALGGRISAAGIFPDIEVAVPIESVDAESVLWSAEHLLLGAVTSDFTTKYLTLAQKTGIEFSGFTCNTYGYKEGASSSLCDIIIKPFITVALPKQVEKALRLVEAAHHKSATINSLKIRVHVMPHITCEKDEC